MVHEVTCPAQTVLVTLVRTKGDRWNGHTQPAVDHVIPCTRDYGAPFLSERGLAGCAGESTGH